MKVSVQGAGPCRKTLRIEVPAETVDAEYRQIVDAYASSASMPGFRAGRAPRAMIERRYAKDIRNELRDRLLPRVYQDALKEAKLHPVALLDVQEPEVKTGAPATLTVTVDVPPDFTLPAFKGLELKAERAPVTDDQVQQMLDSLRGRLATFVDVADRPVQEHDMVQIDFEGAVDGRPLEEAVAGAQGLGKAQGFWFSVGPDAFLPEFVPALTGAAIGDTREADVTFREGFVVAALRGKTAHYRIAVKGIRSRVLPPMDAAFLQPFGVDDEAGLRARLRADLEAAAADRERAALRDQAAKTLLDATQMDLPASVVQRETESIVYDIVRANSRRGIPQQEIVDNKQQIFENAQRGAQGNVKLRYILLRIAEAEKIQVAEDELQAYLVRSAAQYGLKPDDFRAQLEKREALDGVLEDLRMRKTLDTIVAQAAIG